ncbi:MAG: hypothetical protein IT370_37500 [Deltaproteobacteria bacterium]|nr:hypothetical protein [Deltaproteobacteria bacterium]
MAVSGCGGSTSGDDDDGPDSGALTDAATSVDGQVDPPDGAVSPDGAVTTPDSGPPPLLAELGDGTVTLAHNHPCAPALGLASGTSGAPMIVHTTIEQGIRVARLSGNTWTPVGGILNGVGESPNVNICPALVVTPAGVPYVAYATDMANTARVRVRRFVAGNWEDALALDAAPGQFAPALDLDLVPDQNGLPVVVMGEFSNNTYRLTVRTLVGNAFVPLGGTFLTQVFTVRAAVRPDGSVLVFSMSSPTPGRVLKVSVNSAGTWSELPDVTSDAVRQLVPTNIDVTASSILLSYYKTGPGELHTARFDTGSWTELNPTTDQGQDTSLVLTGATSFVHVFELPPTRVDVRRHNGTSFAAPVTIPIAMANAHLVRAGNGDLLMGYAANASAHAGRLNPP